MGKTNFLTLDKTVKSEKKTVFKFIVDANLEVLELTNIEPEDYENVLFLGYDTDYGDVFKCWNNPSVFAIIFGEKGDEFE